MESSGNIIPKVLKKVLSANTNVQRELHKATTNSDHSQPILSILHFNDVYDIQSKYGSRGVCNFKAQVEALRKEYPQALTLFSGDCFSPSTLTNIKNGWQMVHAMNTLNIDVACYGNHEFDFQSQQTLKLAQSCNFPWLLGNITYQLLDKTLGDGKPYIVKEHQGLRIGIMGIAGADWIGVLNQEYDNILQYQDCSQFANRTAEYLRKSLHCDIVIALTHMKNAADRQFPTKVKGVDLVLGGHDHVIMEELIEGTLVVKSGTNFNNVGLLHIYLPSKKAKHKCSRVNIDCDIISVPIFQEVDPDLKKYVDDLMEEYKKYDQVIGYTEAELESRFTKIRRQESNYGNFFADLVKKYYDADCAFINAGMIRNDALIPVGRITYSKVSNIIDSPMVVLKVTGKVIKEALELSVGSYPQFSGQFLFVSGIEFTFDYKKTPRVQSVTIDGKVMLPQKKYALCTTYFQARGGDGFVMLKESEALIDETKATNMLSLLLKFFKAADTHQEYESIKLLAQEDVNNEDEQLPEFPVHHLKLARKVSVRMGRIKDLRSGFVLNDDGRKLTCICPQAEGRVKCLNEE